MAVTVLIDFPIAAERNEQLVAERPELIAPITALFEKYGVISHTRLRGEQRFIDLDVFPSREAYASFKAEAQPLIDRYETALGVRSVDTVWDQGETVHFVS